MSPTPSWRSTSDGRFPRLPGAGTIAAVGAYPQTGSNVFVDNLGTLAGVYRTPAIYAEVTAVFTNTNPMRPYRGNGRPEFAYVIERMVDDAAAELGIDPARAAPPQHDPARGDAVQIRPHLHLRLRRVREEPRHGAAARRLRRVRDAPRRSAGARQAARHRPLQHHRARRRRRLRGGRDPLRPRRHGDPAVGLDHPGPGARDGLQAAAVRPARHRTPNRVHYIQGDTDKVAIGEGTGGSRSAALGGSAVHARRPRRSSPRRKASPRTCCGAAEGEVEFADGIFTAPRSNRALDDRRDRGRGVEPAEPARKTWSRGSIAERGLHAPSSRISPTAAMSASSRSTPRPARSRSCATASSTMSAR